MTKINIFDVFAEMVREDNQALKLAALNNITHMKFKERRGTDITIGFPGNVIAQISEGMVVGGLVLVEKKEYEAARKRLEAKA